VAKVKAPEFKPQHCQKKKKKKKSARQEDWEFKASLDYLVRPYLKSSNTYMYSL
jgi:hypothetical protein